MGSGWRSPCGGLTGSLTLDVESKIENILNLAQAKPSTYS